MNTSFRDRQIEIIFESLESIPFRWGGGPDSLDGMDCLGFASYARQVLGEPGINLEIPELAQIYRDYIGPNEMPQEKPLELAKSLLNVSFAPRHLDLVVIRSPEGECLSTYLNLGAGREYLALMGAKSSRIVRFKHIQGGQISGIFDPEAILLPEVWADAI